MDDLDPFAMVVGLEVHAELLTATKLFCACPNQFGAEPNTTVCPVCLGLPGSLPVLNERAVELALRLGGALSGSVEPSVFHRKNYFYPDMPKDYQISQYDRPIVVGGHVELPDGSRVRLVRAHLEEDTGKTVHVGASGRIHGARRSLVDYNRAGVPLLEIVSEPDITSSAMARAYASELRAILVATGVSDGKMEEGSLRMDANVSVRRAGEPLGTRCEIKNLNSLRSLQRAIDHEARRQRDLIAGGGTVRQETRHWDEARGVTSTMRVKEEAEDYRYFREPDLVDVVPTAAWFAAAQATAPLPASRRRAYAERLTGPSVAQMEWIAVVVANDLDEMVDAAAGASGDLSLALARAANEVAGERGSLTPTAFADAVALEARGDLSATQVKSVLAALIEQGGDAATIARGREFERLTDDDLATTIDHVIAAYPVEFARFVDGDEKVAQFFVGQVMKASSGRANGQAVRHALAQRRDATR